MIKHNFSFSSLKGKFAKSIVTKYLTPYLTPFIPPHTLLTLKRKLSVHCQIFTLGYHFLRILSQVRNTSTKILYYVKYTVAKYPFMKL